MMFEQSMSRTPGLLGRLREAVRGTRQSLAARIEQTILARKEISPEMLDELEEVLIGADLGVATATHVIEQARRRLDRRQLNDISQLRQAMRQDLLDLLIQGAPRPRSSPDPKETRPRVVFVVGVNGTGKTTTVGKLANRLVRGGQSVLIAAADTFRAAAVEQLTVWAERCGAQILTMGSGGSPAAVVFDALQAAEARGTDVVLADTAGRLHTKSNLMQELEKMKRIAGKKVPGAPHEVLLVLDATTGQNGLAQAREFTRTAGVTGLVVTKLDGTAKGGVVFSVVQELGLPVLFAGIGEGIDDLIEFSPEDFVDSLFGNGSPEAPSSGR